MTASRLVVKHGRYTAEHKAEQNGHRLGLWLRQHDFQRATCYTCGARATIDYRGSISGPALTAHCKVPETAGRAA